MIQDPRPSEAPIDEPTLRALLRAQHPDLAGRPLNRAGEGFDCVVYRLEGEPPLALRLPRRAVAARAVEAEIRWLPQLAPALPLAIPAPTRAGAPGEGFPFCWSIAPWMQGQTADLCPPQDLARAATQLRDFLLALHQPAPPEAPISPYRGVPLAARDAGLRPRLPELPDGAAELWEQALAAPLNTVPRWCHGDLHPGNLITRDGALAAVIDWGDLSAGDPAVDLIVAWLLLPAEHRGVLRDAVDEAAWLRGRGWALVWLSFAMTVGGPEFGVWAREKLADLLA